MIILKLVYFFKFRQPYVKLPEITYVIADLLPLYYLHLTP
jgi:hypothetical protein